MKHIIRQTVVYLVLAVVTLVAFEHVCANGFISMDDPKYVVNNPFLKEGFSAAGLRWAWTDFQYCMWNPLTRMSLLLDYQLHGLDPWGYHLTNLLLHLANVLLLFYVLRRLTGAAGRSFVAAALFAVHPLRVESVAWVTERKDVLSTCFALLAIVAYMAYVRRPHWSRYLGLLAAFLLSLLSKPIWVTLPFLLLLLDYWPLGRLRFAAKPTADGGPSRLRLLGEKGPLFVIAAVFAAITALTHEKLGALNALGDLPLHWRIANGIVAYVRYVAMTFWPRDLALVYPHPLDQLPLTAILGAGLLLALGTAAALRWRRDRPYLVVGWFWFLGALIPVIGLVPNTNCALADRYTYVPHIGLLMLLTWGGADLCARLRLSARVVGPLAAAILLACTLGTRSQVLFWHDSTELWRHTLAVTPNNAVAFNEYGGAIFCKDRVAEAKDYFATAVRLDPKFTLAHLNLGTALLAEGNLNESKEQFEIALGRDPQNYYTHASLAQIMDRQGKLGAAADYYAEAVRLQPDYLDGWINRGGVLDRLGRVAEAADCYRTAVAVRPTSAVAQANLGILELRRDHLDEAELHLTEAVRLDPADPEARLSLATLLVNRGNLPEGERDLHQILASHPESGEAHFNLGVVLERQGKLTEAVVQLQDALRLLPDYLEAADNLGVALERLGRLSEAEACYREAQRRHPRQVNLCCNLASVLYAEGRVADAAHEYSEAARLDPSWLESASRAAWMLATHPDPAVRNGSEAVRVARQICEATGDKAPEYLDVLAASYAEVGDFEHAVETSRAALAKAEPRVAPVVVAVLRERLRRYEAHLPFRDATVLASR